MTKGFTKGSTKGFTLIEVLVAFVVAALVLGAGAQALSAAARQAARLQHQARALELAEAKLAQAGFTEAIAPGFASGEQDELRWRRRVAPFYPAPFYREEGESAAATWVAYRVTVEAQWGAEPAVRLEGVRLGKAP